MARSVQVVITADARGVGRGVAQANAQLRQLQSTASRSQQSVSRIEGMFDTFSKGAVAAAGIAAVGTAVMQVVNSASRLQQAQGAVETVFKGQAGALIAGADAWEKYGLSQNQVLETQALLGAQLKNLGVPVDGLSTQVNGLIKLAADLAATFGGSTQLATEALSSALRGEYERIERYGISIKQSQVDALAASEGLTKQQALMKIVFTQSADAMGQADREIDTFASRQQAAAAAIENAKTALGQGFLPVATKAAQVVGGLASAVGSLPSGLLEFATQAALAGAAIKGITTVSALGQAKLGAWEASLAKAGKPTRALGAGLGQLALAQATSLKVLLPVAAAVGITALAYNQYRESIERATGAQEDWNAAVMSGNDLPTIDTSTWFDRNILGMQKQAVSLQELARTYGGIKVGIGDRIAALYDTEDTGIKDTVENVDRLNSSLSKFVPALQQLAAVDPSRALQMVNDLLASFPTREAGLAALDAAGFGPEQFKALEDAAGSAKGQVDQLTSSFQALQETAKLVQSALESVFAPRSLVEAKIALRDAKTQLDDVLSKDGATRDTRVQGVIDYAKAWQEVSQRQIENGASQQRVLRTWQNARDAAGKALRNTTSMSGKEIRRTLDVAFGKKYEIKASLKAANVKKDITGLGAAVGAIAKKDPVIKVTAQVNGAKSDIKGVQKELNSLKQRDRPKVDVNGGLAKRSIADVKSSLNAIPDETVDIYVRLTGPGASKLGGAGGSGSARQSSAQSMLARSGVSLTALEQSLADWLVTAVRYARKKAQKEMDRGIRISPNFFAASFASGKNNPFLVDFGDFGISKSNEKVRVAWKRITKGLKRENQQLLGDLQSAWRNWIDNVNSSISFFSIGDALSEAKSVQDDITSKTKEMNEAYRDSWDHLSPIIAELQTTTDPARLAELRNTYNTLIAAGPMQVADTEKRAQLEREIAELQQKDTLSEQLALQAARTQALADSLRSLKQQGLSKGAIAEILKAGPEAGLEMAQALLSNGALLRQFDATFKSTKATAEALARDAQRWGLAGEVDKAEKKLAKFWRTWREEAQKQLDDFLKSNDLKLKVQIVDNSGGSNRRSSSAASVQGVQPVTYNITINGAIDPEGTARTVKRVLNQHAARIGR